MDDQFKNRFLLYLASGILMVCVAYFFAVTFIPVTPSGQKYADIILGALIGAGFTGMISFYYGSSKSAQDKAETMKTMTKDSVSSPSAAAADHQAAIDDLKAITVKS
jgi:prepilin signal peptidase PulO-like enzyme (type II secretory pathway)